MGKINFMGDLIIGDQPVIFGIGLDSRWSKNGYSKILRHVERPLKEADFNVINFECTIKSRPERENIINWSMCCDERICDELVKAGINVVSVANNHSFDYGKEGFENTVDAFKKCGIQVIGKKEAPGIVLKIGGKKIGLIAASYLKTRSDDVEYFFKPSREEWKNAIEQLGEIDKCIAYIHWGNEFIVNPAKTQIDIMNELILLGIDDIVGHHSHILQSNYIAENGNCIFFSLGNFVSDYWQSRLRKSVIVQYNVKENEYYSMSCDINEEGIPIERKNFRKVEFKRNYDVADNVFANRIRIRVEYLIKILCNFYKIKGKRYFLLWLIKRIKYVVFNMFAEIKNPDIIYEKYER